MKPKKKMSRIMLCVALALCLISMIGVSLIQTDGHQIEIKQMTWETSAGHQIAADLWIHQMLHRRHRRRQSLRLKAGTITKKCRTFIHWNWQDAGMLF